MGAASSLQGEAQFDGRSEFRKASWRREPSRLWNPRLRCSGRLHLWTACWVRQRSLSPPSLPPLAVFSIPVFVFYSCYNKIPGTGWAKPLRLISHSPGGWKFKIRAPPWLADGRRLAVSSHGLFSMCLHPWCPPPLPMRTPVLLDEGPTLETSFTLSYLCMDPVSKCSPFGLQSFRVGIWVGSKIQSILNIHLTFIRPWLAARSFVRSAL